MKSTINLENTKTHNVYPCLKIFNNMIVFFTDIKTGVCLVNDTETRNYIGRFSNTWGEENFTPFNGTVTLSND